MTAGLPNYTMGATMNTQTTHWASYLFKQ